MFEKRFQGAPFGTQKSRFDVNGIHPKSKTPGTFTEIVHDKRYMSLQNRKLGPGSYDIDNGCFDTRAVRERASGPGWERAYLTSQESKLPHLLYREEWERKQLQKQLSGPGTYDLPDSYQDLKKKPGSLRGICASRCKRFSNPVSDTPGPGTYGENGVPHAMLEAKAKQSFSMVGMMDARSSGKRQLPEVGCALCPGQYEVKSFTDEMKDKVVSLRGPYDIFSGDRNKPITTGHYARMTKAHLGPGEYEIKSFLDDLNDKHKERHGRFSKLSRNPSVPSERLLNFCLAQWPRKSDEPGPGQYNPSVPTAQQVRKSPPFGSSAKRVDKHAMIFFMGNTNPVGAGRYHIRSRQHDYNGHKSAFDSTARRWDPTRDKFLIERIRSKDVPVKDRVFLLPLSA